MGTTFVEMVFFIQNIKLANIKLHELFIPEQPNRKSIPKSLKSKELIMPERSEGLKLVELEVD